MKAWYQGLESRERIILTLGAIFAAIALFYMLVWSPISASNVRLEDSLVSNNEIIAELRKFEGRIPAPASGSNAGQNSDRALVLLISQTVGRFGLTNALQSSKPSSNDSTVTVRFDNASFDSLVAWVGDLQSSHGLNVRSASFRRAGTSGRVNSTLTLERL